MFVSNRYLPDTIFWILLSWSSADGLANPDRLPYPLESSEPDEGVGLNENGPLEPKPGEPYDENATAIRSSCWARRAVQIKWQNPQTARKNEWNEKSSEKKTQLKPTSNTHTLNK